LLRRAESPGSQACTKIVKDSIRVGQKNADGSVDVYLGPKPPAGKESNRIPADPARTFELMFRLYAPTQASFDKCGSCRTSRG
jgi:hypothetical protein